MTNNLEDALKEIVYLKSKIKELSEVYANADELTAQLIKTRLTMYHTHKRGLEETKKTIIIMLAENGPHAAKTWDSFVYQLSCKYAEMVQKQVNLHNVPWNDKTPILERKTPPA